MKTLLLCAIVVVTFGGCSGGRGEGAPKFPRQHAGWESGFVNSNGIRLHYWRTGGSGKPVMILAHGITDYGLSWTSLAERMEQDYDLILYDARGHGYSDKPGGPYDLATHVEDLVGLIRALGVEKPILMGHSMGGGTVALVAATYPDLPRAVILEDPADMQTRLRPLGEEDIVKWKKQIQVDRDSSKESLMARAQTKIHPGWQDADYECWGESKLLVTPNVVDIIHGRSFGDAVETYPKIVVPTLVLKADADVDANSRAKHLEMARLLPHGTLVYVEGAGHVIHNDKPAETERRVRDFLSGL